MATIGQSYLMNLPVEIIEEILHYLRLVDRKNLRLTCKGLYELCNKGCFCKNELISWSRRTDQRVILAYCKSTRSCYNLALNDMELDDSVLSFFKVQGSRLYSLSMIHCKLSTGQLEEIIMNCEALCNLSIKYPLGDWKFEMKSGATRPRVTSFQFASCSQEESSIYCPRIFSTFINVNHLHIKVNELGSYDSKQIETSFSAIFDEIMKLSCLESLELDLAHSKLFSKGSQFFNALPKYQVCKFYCVPINSRGLLLKFEKLMREINGLKNLCLDWENVDQEVKKRQKWFPYLQHLSSIEFRNLEKLISSDVVLLLSSNNLENLILSVKNIIVLTTDIFKALVSSQLKIINFSAYEIKLPIIRDVDKPTVVNETVTDLTLDYCHHFYIRAKTLSLFSTYFRGLVHLELGKIENVVLQSIFECQENLRSLYLHNCGSCTVAGFAGTGKGNFKYSINKLQKLEHLTIICIKTSVIKSKNLKAAFRFPRLKYLFIENCYEEEDDFGYPEMPIKLLQPLTNLEAIKLTNFLVPSSKKLLPLYKNLKRLKFLRFHRNIDDAGDVFIDLKYFSINVSDYEHRTGEHRKNYYEKTLDRMVLVDQARGKILYWPRISSYTIDWIWI